MVHHCRAAVDETGGWSCENPTFLSNAHSLCKPLSDLEVVYLARVAQPKHSYLPRYYLPHSSKQEGVLGVTNASCLSLYMLVLMPGLSN